MAPFRRLRGTREVSLFATEFATDGEAERIVPGDDAFRLVRGWLAPDAADALLATIQATTRWTQERRMMYDRMVDVPREQAWYGEGFDAPWNPELARVRDALAGIAGHFDYVLLNRYRNGRDSVAWHNDRTAPDAPEPIVASLTLGATRSFDVRAKLARASIISVDLDHGDLIVMGAGSQTRFEHRVPKDTRVSGERINLTFRRLPPDRVPER